MNVIVDTCVWSEVLRRNSANSYIRNMLSEFIEKDSVVVIGAIRQELLSGVSDEAKFRKLKSNFSAFKDVCVTTVDYEYAAEISNKCRKRGIQGSNTDFLICSIALRNSWSIFTLDKDFWEFQKVLPLTLI